MKTPKIVSIPVHFVGSTSAKRATSATKIQKIFRGFLVRKSIKEILAIGSEVDKAEIKVLDGLDSIRKDPKERLKINETLMALLFKLDSVLAPGPGVRDCRKAVIKKAIVLQEIIDGCDEIIGDDVSRNTNCEIGADVENKFLRIEDDNVTEIDMMEGGDDDDDDRSQSLKCDKFVDFVKDCDKLEERIDTVADEDMMEGCEDRSQLIKCDELVDFEAEKDKDEEDYCFVKQVVVGEREYNEYNDAKLMAKKVENDFLDDEFKSEKTSNKEILERMIEENGKMMGLMKQLSEQNQAQTQMLTVLSQRVEHLEKAFVRKILRKKSKDKKKRMVNGVTEELDFCPDQKKCGKKR